MQLAFFLENPALDIFRWVRPRVLLDDVRVLDGHGVLQPVYRQDFARLAFRAARHDPDHVAMADSDRDRLFHFLFHRYHTSGASEMILVNFLSRSSLATGPNTRVPIGSFASLISTAALSSNLIYVPSFRLCSLRVRTTTARTTFPFFTWLSGVASFTAAVITSPSDAVNPASPPSGRMQVIWRAPELSATVSHVLI